MSEGESNRLRFRQEQEVEPQVRHEEQGVTFENVEELIRSDVRQTEPPGTVKVRLAEELDAQPAPRASWFRRLFS